MLKYIMLIIVAVSAFADVPIHTNTGTFNATTNATGDFNAFSWQWMGYDGQAINVNLLPVGSANVMMRMSYPRRGTVFLDVSGTYSGSNFTASVNRTNLPPDGVYFCEFLGYTTSITNLDTRSLATGMINIQHSLFQNTTQSSWTNPLAGTVIGPPIHTLSDLSLWPFVQTNSTLFYPMNSNPSNYVSSTVADDRAWTNKLDPSATNGFIKLAEVPADNLGWQSFPTQTWNTVTAKADTATLSGYVQTNDSRLTDNRTDGAAWHYGDSVTGAVDGVARGLTNYDEYGAALAVSNAFTNAAALAVTALQKVNGVVDPSDSLATAFGNGSEIAGYIHTASDAYAGSDGSMIRGALDSGSHATNNGTGALQLLDLGGQNALTTAGGDGSLLLGAGVASNRYAIVAGDGQASRGDGSITAGGGFYGSGSNLTGITAAQVGAMAIGATASNVTTEAVVQAGAVTNAPFSGIFNPVSLLPFIASNTNTFTLGMISTNSSWYLSPTGTVYFTADATLTDTNLEAGFTLNLFYNAQTFGFVGASVSNTATLTSNAWNNIIFWKGYGSSQFIGK